MHKKYGLEWQTAMAGSNEEERRIAELFSSRIPLFDRHEELFFFDRESDAIHALEELSRRDISAERSEWLSVPAGNTDAGERFDDFALVTEAGYIYFDLAYAVLFRLTAGGPEAEIAPALMQLEEFRIASVWDDARPRDPAQAWHAIERQLAELVERIARAYSCGVEWLDVDRL